jgi:hypothetical protein
MSGFIGGLRLSHLFYEEAVAPIMAAQFPGLAYAAALIGPGSEVLGYDTPLSADHSWGPRLLLFLTEADDDAHGSAVVRVLAEHLPRTFRRYPTEFPLPATWSAWSRHGEPPGPVKHNVLVGSLGQFSVQTLGLDPRQGLQAADWLCLPELALLEMTAGAVFHDGLGEVEALRASLAYYPRDVWLYRMAAQWTRIAQQEAFVGRTGDVGDELGSGLVAAGLVRDLMRLCFMLERRYAPYSKWFGTAFARLEAAPTVEPLLQRVLASGAWREREAHLCAAYEAVATLHNQLGLTPHLDVDVTPFFSRPYLVIGGGRFAEALQAAIADPVLRALPPFGAVDQLSDATDVISDPAVCRRLRALYDGSCRVVE